MFEFWKKFPKPSLLDLAIIILVICYSIFRHVHDAKNFPAQAGHFLNDANDPRPETVPYQINH
jgi:hypothetical protein